MGRHVRGGHRQLVLPALVATFVLAASSLVGTATQAAFTARSSTGSSSLTAGTVTLGADSASSAVFSEPALVPGATVSRCVAVTYTGNLPALVHLYGTFAGSLAPYVTFTVEQGSGGSFASCSGFTPAQTLFAGTGATFAASATGFAAGVGTFAPTGAGQTITYRFTAGLEPSTPSARQGDTASGLLTWEARDATPTTGSVSGYGVPGGGTVDLASVGAVDWAQWGMTGKYAVNRRAGVTPAIPAWGLVGNPSTVWYYSDPTTTFTWSGGTPTAAPGSPSGYRVYTGGVGNGLQLVVPAGAAARTLRVYVGVDRAEGQLTATLSDGTLAYVGTPVSDPAGATDTVYTLTFASTTPGATLTVNWVQTADLDLQYGSGTVNLQAAALQ